ncbi:hypothetical protein KUCAC02_017072 [Chaenocephalus aceratus]|nr:hypothetical protein KUCAC02_017072 [Chaenocephalus aceratus]
MCICVTPQEERRMTKEDTERRVEASERMKSRSSSSVDGDEMFSPFSPKAPKVNIACSTCRSVVRCPGFRCRHSSNRSNVYSVLTNGNVYSFLRFNGPFLKAWDMITLCKSSSTSQRESKDVSCRNDLLTATSLAKIQHLEVEMKRFRRLRENLTSDFFFFQITERTESLSRSLKKSNSFKKTQAARSADQDRRQEGAIRTRRGEIPMLSHDSFTVQFVFVLQNSQEARAVKASLSDLPGSPEVVSSKKNRFEAGETWSPSRGASCKDTEGLKVGVANRITQWVKGPTDGSRTSLKPADVRPGEGSAAGKKYKFVVTGHGKYEKIPVDEDGEEFADGEDGETRTLVSQHVKTSLYEK